MKKILQHKTRGRCYIDDGCQAMQNSYQNSGFQYVFMEDTQKRELVFRNDLDLVDTDKEDIVQKSQENDTLTDELCMEMERALIRLRRYRENYLDTRKHASAKRALKDIRHILDAWNSKPWSRTGVK